MNHKITLKGVGFDGAGLCGKEFFDGEQAKDKMNGTQTVYSSWYIVFSWEYVLALLKLCIY